MSKKNIPHPPWAAKHFWSFEPYPITVASGSFFVFGIGDGLLLCSGLGNSPWTVLAQGISQHLDINVGTAGFLISILLLALWIPLRIKIGLGTLLNALLISVALGVTASIVPTPVTYWGQVLMCLVGISLSGIAAAIYLSCNLGTGPRDGIMVAFSTRFHWKLSWVRTGIELFACISGYFLGGIVGVGTVLFALLVGPILGKTVTTLANKYPAPKVPFSTQDKP